MKFKFVPFRSLSKFAYLRLGLGYELPEIKYPYTNLTNCIKNYESGKRPSGGINYLDYGQVLSLGGEQIGKDGFVDLNNMPFVSYDFYDKQKKGRVKDKDILLCKDGALTGKSCIVYKDDIDYDQVLINEHVFRIQSNDRISQVFLFYLMQLPLFKLQIKDLAFKKKGQPGLNQDHMKALKIPDVPFEIQLLFEEKISPIEKEIRELKSHIVNMNEVITDIFNDYFSYDKEGFKEQRDIRVYNAPFNYLGNNRDIRFSARFHRPSGYFVLEELLRRPHIKIKKCLSLPMITGQGISTSDYDYNGEYVYVSMADICSWELDIDEIEHVSDEYAESNLSKRPKGYSEQVSTEIKVNDILMMRSGEGGIGKVAIVKDDIKGIFCDFIIRMRFDETVINPDFAYFYFRSNYFQYLVEINKKGLGNNTNIFPNQVQEFPIPYLSLDEQQVIVDRVNVELNRQHEIAKAIKAKQEKITRILNELIM